MSNKVHLLTYANNQPFLTSQQQIKETFPLYTKKEFIIHEHNSTTIRTKSWFKYLEEFKRLPPNKRREDSWYVWKPFLTEDLYNQMNDGDILFYVDSSRHYKGGFAVNVDKLLQFAETNGHIAGSVGKNVTNDTKECCHDPRIWNHILKNNNHEFYLKKLHVLCSWFVLCKNETTNSFVREWSALVKEYVDGVPLISLHHTGDQSIFNVLAYKYNLTVFFHPDHSHEMNKNPNLVTSVLNKTVTPETYFKKCHETPGVS